jgi:hypothetical protein
VLDNGDYAIWALIGAASGSIIMGFAVSWLLREGRSMVCKRHGECQGCRLDEAEDTARQLDVKYGSLWAVLNDIEPKLAIKQSQMREYVDEQIRLRQFEIKALDDRICSLAEALEELKK